MQISCTVKLVYTGLCHKSISIISRKSVTDVTYLTKIYIWFQLIIMPILTPLMGEEKMLSMGLFFAATHVSTFTNFHENMYLNSVMYRTVVCYKCCVIKKCTINFCGLFYRTVLYRIGPGSEKYIKDYHKKFLIFEPIYNSWFSWLQMILYSVAWAPWVRNNNI